MKNISVYLKTYSTLLASEIDKNIQFGLNRNADLGRSVFPSVSMHYPNTDIWIGYLFLYNVLYSSYIVHTNITSGHIWTLFERETLTEILQECPVQDRCLDLTCHERSEEGLRSLMFFLLCILHVYFKDNRKIRWHTCFCISWLQTSGDSELQVIMKQRQERIESGNKDWNCRPARTIRMLFLPQSHISHGSTVNHDLQ